MNSSGRTVVVTGAGRGIGRAASLRFARRGDRVVLAARSADQLAETARAIGDESRCLTVAADVSVEADTARIMSEAVRRFGRIDVLVNNAGMAPLAPIERMDTATFDRMIAVNVRGLFLCCRAAWPHLRAAGGGVIVNISSRAASDPFPGFAAYGGSKAFVETFTRALGAEGAAEGIRVFGVAPGAVATRMLLDLFPDFPRDKSLDPDEVSGLIEGLCDERFHACSGQTLGIARPE